MNKPVEMVYRNDFGAIRKHCAYADYSYFGFDCGISNCNRNSGCVNIKTGLSL